MQPLFIVQIVDFILIGQRERNERNWEKMEWSETEPNGKKKH